METTTRIIAKAVCWQLLGLASMTVIGFLFTGSIAAGGGLALTTAAIGFATYILHEKAWAAVRWGRRQG